MSERQRLSPKFSTALGYAADLHIDQRRKISGEPYVAHLLAVAAIVLENGGDEEEAIAAMLHDAIEDQGHATSREEIARRFSPRVADIVDACSDADSLPKPPWQERKDAYIARLRGASPSIRLVVAADKLHNVRSILREHWRHGEDLWCHFYGGRDGTLWYYRTVVETLKQSEITPLVRELDHAVADLESLLP